MASPLERLAANLADYPETQKYVNQYIGGAINDDQFSEILENLPTDLDDYADDEDADVYMVNELPDYRDQPFVPVQLTNEQKLAAEQRMQLMTRKGVYPYEYFDSMEKFEENTLPTKNHFYSTLKEETISDEEYAHAQNVFNSLQMRSLKDYHNFYLLCDVLLLADVFEAFRTMCKSHYDLDPAAFFTAPGLAWQAALKMTKVKLELLTDIEKHLFIEAGIRGGVSVITHRYAKSNIPGEDDYDDTKPTEYLIYWDANNLYGWAMSQYLPIKDFRWLSADEIAKLNIMDLKDDANIGYILEVDLGEFDSFFKMVISTFIFLS